MGFGIARNVNQKGFKEVTVNPFINATLTGLRTGSASNHVWVVTLVLMSGLRPSAFG